ncbi:hypothetical protein ACF0H5_019216 [Mactra antiquata]
MKVVLGLVILACAMVFVSGQSRGAATSSGENNMASYLGRMGGMSALGGGGGLGSMGGMGGLASMMGGAGGMGNALLLGGGMDMNNLMSVMLCTRVMPAAMCFMNYMN